jgi:hypothetical protein
MRRMAILGLCFLLLACASITETQKPTSPVGDKAEKELNDLSRINPALADELWRLPELKRGLNEKGVLALRRVVTLYSESKNTEMKLVFNRILSIGKKEHRKFSASLQALFWAAEEQELPLIGSPLKIFQKEKYTGFNKNIGEDEEVITFVYNIWEKTYHTDKWKDPIEIMDRLNSPHLFDLFFRDNIAYDYAKFMMILGDHRYFENWVSYLQSANTTIKRRKGVCQDATNLAVEILTKAGYDVKPLQVKFRSRATTGSDGTWVAVLKEGGLLYKIAENYFQYDGIVGPYKSIKEIAEKVSESKGVFIKDYSLSLVPIR